MCSSALLACVTVHNMCAWCLQMPEGTGFPRAGVIDSCEMPRECWESNLALEEQPVLKTAEMSLQPLKLK